jgi:hypothetical protein
MKTFAQFWKRLKDLFVETSEEEIPAEEPKSGYEDFTVEHYPETDRYYPTYRGHYIQRDYQTGIYELVKPFLFAYADCSMTEAGAWRIIDLFKEQRLKENVRILRR